MYKYKNIIFEDVETKESIQSFKLSVSSISLCEQCVAKYGLNNNKLDKIEHGCCMVFGCENTADYYIDFNEGEVNEPTIREIMEFRKARFDEFLKTLPYSAQRAHGELEIVNEPLLNHYCCYAQRMSDSTFNMLKGASDYFSMLFNSGVIELSECDKYYIIHDITEDRYHQDFTFDENYAEIQLGTDVSYSATLFLKKSDAEEVLKRLQEDWSYSKWEIIEKTVDKE